jgi:hypothetical protein
VYCGNCKLVDLVIPGSDCVCDAIVWIVDCPGKLSIRLPWSEICCEVVEVDVVVFEFIVCSEC